MNTNLSDVALDETLRALDASTGVDSAHRARAEAMLTALVDGTDAPPAPVRPIRRRTYARWFALAGAAAGLGLIVTVMPGAKPQDAFASWTAQPSQVDPATKAQATKACTDAMKKASAPIPGVPASEQPAPQGDPVFQVAEQRGDYILVALAGDQGGEFNCLSKAATPDQLMASGGGLPSVGVKPVTPAADGLVSNGASLFGFDGTGLAVVQGTVGKQVVGVTAHSAGKSVKATLDNGLFAAWWPTATPDASAPLGVTFDVTLADRRVITGLDGGQLGKLPGPREIGRVARGAGVTGGAVVNTVSGIAGAAVAEVVIHVEGRDVAMKVKDGSFAGEWETGEKAPTTGTVTTSDFPPATYSLRLVDGTVLDHVKPVSGADS